TTASSANAKIKVRNAGKGRMTVQAQLNQTGLTFTFPLGNQGTTNAGNGNQAFPGAGGGPPGGGIVIPFPVPGGGTVTNPGQVTIPPGNAPGANGGNAATTQTQQNAVASTAPVISVEQGGSEATVTFSYNTRASTSIGTIMPSDILIQSPEAIN